MLLVTGANGQLGRAIVEELLRLRPEGGFAVSVRDPEAAADLADRGVEVRRGDYGDPDSLKAAFSGVDRLLLMPTPEPDPVARVAHHKAAVDAAVAAGVAHVVYPSAYAADRVDNSLVAAHKQTEDLLTASGAAWTMLRNAIYADVIAMDVQGALAAGELAAPAGDVAIAPVLRRDLAVATAAVLVGEGHENRAYELTAPDTVGWVELADIAAQRTGKPVAYRNVDDEEMSARLTAAGLPDGYVPIMLGFYAAYRSGWCGTPSGDFETLVGRPATSARAAVEAVIDGTAK